MRSTDVLYKQPIEEFASVLADFNRMLPEGVRIIEVVSLEVKPPNPAVVLGIPIIEGLEERGVIFSVAGGEHNNEHDVEVVVNTSDGGVHALDCPLSIKE